MGRADTAGSADGSFPAGRSSPRLIVATLSMCGIVVALQQTLLLPLLPDLPGLIGTSADNATWLITATLLTGAVATPTISRLADMYGKKRLMLVALGVSVLGSLVGALSTALPLLIGARALQGVGMALIPVGIAIMRDELPRDRLPLGIALMSATLAVGAGAGLPLSGVIAEQLDWHAIFWLTGAVGVLLLIAAAVVLTESPVRTRGSFDLRGAVVLSAALTAVLLALSKGGQWGWTSPETWGLATAGIALLGFWVPLELRTPNPLVDIRVAARRPVLLANVASIFAGFAMFANMLVTTQELQAPLATGYGLGRDVLQTGLWMVPSAAAFGLVAPVSAWCTRRFGPSTTLIVGAGTMGVSYVVRVFTGEALWQVVTASVVISVGTSLVYGAMPTLITRAVPMTETASANGLNVLLRSLGTSTASATMAAITSFGLVEVGSVDHPSASALTAILCIAGAASLGAALIGVPLMRLVEYSEEPADGLRDERADRRQARVVRGRIESPAGRPIRNAVVTILTPTGDPVDWGQADSEGQFAAAIPGSGAYLVVTTAEGWRPQSELVTLDGDHPLPTTVLHHRLTLSGTITGPDGPAADALVVVTRQSGEAVTTVRTDVEGRYELPRPPNGRYVLTAVARDGVTAARSMTVWEMARTVDLSLPDLPAVPQPKDDATSGPPGDLR